MASEHVFVSYTHVDIDYVRRLVDFLRGEGVEVWFDEQIPTSQRWDLELEHRIDTCRAVLVVMSPAARGSYWVGVELDHARRQKRPIFPLLLDGKPLFGLGVLQYESVVGGLLPSPGLVQQLRDLPDGDGALAAGESAVPVRIRQIGVVPGAADCLQQRPMAEQLDRELTEHGSAIVTQIVSGLGGVGKTQLAAAVVRQLGQSYAMCLWRQYIQTGCRLGAAQFDHAARAWRWWEFLWASPHVAGHGHRCREQAVNQLRIMARPTALNGALSEVWHGPPRGGFALPAFAGGPCPRKTHGGASRPGCQRPVTASHGIRSR